jgi:hypothetical protein
MQQVLACAVEFAGAGGAAPAATAVELFAVDPAQPAVPGPHFLTLSADWAPVLPPMVLAPQQG